VSTHKTPDFKTRAISPASFGNWKAPPLPVSERIMCRGRSPGRLVHSEVVLITEVRLAYDCRQHGSKFLLFDPCKSPLRRILDLPHTLFNRLTKCQLVGCAVVEILLEKFTLEEIPIRARTYAGSSKAFWHRECLYPES
jgi:hypothetical protein